MLERLCLVQGCPNSVRAVTEDLGAVLIQHTHHATTAAQDQGVLPSAPAPLPTQLYVSMDGVVVHCRRTGWRELKTGCIYTTRAQRARRAPHDRILRMEQPSYPAALAEAAPFGWQLCVAAARRGVAQAAEVIVIGAGAHWIWNLADLHFPGATQIVDWYHASQYLWNAATAIHGEGTIARTNWAKAHLNALWDGRIDEVLAALEPHAGDAGAVDATVSYYTTQRTRMDYPSYRARGLQIGSGTIESTCKHLVSARLKQAGMIWSEAGADAVVSVRAWLKRGRWAEAMALRPAPRRRSQQSVQQASPVDGSVAPNVATPPVVTIPPARELPVDVRERVRAEVAAEQVQHPWRRAWSIRQHRRQAAAPRRDGQMASAA